MIGRWGYHHRYSQDKYDNLILLCSIHHKIIDDQVKEYSVEKLQQFKKEHENWILKNLLNDTKKIKEDELYATYIEHFIKETDLHNWNTWSSWIFGTSETISKQRIDALRELSNYIVSRIWPHRYPDLESSLINFKNVLNSLMIVFDKYVEERPDSYGTERFYRKTRGGEAVYKKLLQKYEYHVCLVEDLMIELTRAANYVCDKIREFIFEGFRLQEGVILITRGDMMGYQSIRVEYRDTQRIEFPYPGLREFMTIRKERDFSVGEGVNEDYFNNITY